MKIQTLIVLSFAALIVTIGCSENSMAPDDEIEALSESEQSALVATEVAQQTGGMLADLEMAVAAATGDFSSLAKPASVDTTISAGWLTYDLSLSYYNERGIEQPAYVPGLTDSLSYRGQLTGVYDDSRNPLVIDLNTVSSFEIADIKSGVVTIDGSGANNSTYQLAGKRRTLNIVPTSTYSVEEVVVDLNSGEFVPQSGRVTGTISGVFSAETAEGGQEKTYEFTFTLQFNGNNKVTITLPDGRTLTLNLETGEIS